ncbi:Protein of unknown function [Thermobacillus xylanilyticus]|nr:Protein of unknown function [Thermobacillus xylanilyticus]
MKFFRL